MKKTIFLDCHPIHPNSIMKPSEFFNHVETLNKEHQITGGTYWLDKLNTITDELNGKNTVISTLHKVIRAKNEKLIEMRKKYNDLKEERTSQIRCQKNKHTQTNRKRSQTKYT